MYNLFLKLISVSVLFLSAAVCVAAGNGKFTLVIDAGHGGKDSGAPGRYSKEKNINLKVALAFGRLVENNCSDVRVIYTRKTDIFVPLDRRAEIANNAKADLFISVHTNSLPKGRIAYGTETYTLGIARADENLEVAKRENSVIMYEANYKQAYHGFDPNKVESYIIFELLQDKNMEQSVEMARCLQQQYVSHAGRRNKGVHQAGFLVLRNTSMPAILTELGFISTPAEENFLNSEAGVKKLARSLFNGFQNYRRKFDKNCGPLVNLKEVAEEEPEIEGKEERERPEPPVRPEPEIVQARAGSMARSSREKNALEPNTVDRPVFKVQLLVSDRKLKLSDRRFKGIRPVDYYREKGMYKYTYGSTTNYNEAKRWYRSVSAKLRGAFIVAFRNGERMNLAEAIKMSKRK